MMAKENTVIGFIGTGVMGKSMASHLIAAGYELVLYTRTKEKAQALLDKGAKWASSPQEVAAQANLIITIVGYPHDVEEIYLGKDGLIPNGRPGSYFIDMTTSQPTLAKKIHEEAKKRNISTLDCPVSGGDIGARDGKLAIMVGGQEKDFIKVEPILKLMGSNIVYQGSAGAGQHTKICNQIVIASTMVGISESVVYAKRAGLDVNQVLKSISTGAASSWSLTNLAPKMVTEDYQPGFYIKHFIKDLAIALEEAERLQMDIPGVALAKRLYDELARAGEENNGTQALVKYWQEKTEIER